MVYSKNLGAQLLTETTKTNIRVIRDIRAKNPLRVLSAFAVQNNRENPVNPVKNLLDRINRINRMFSPFPGEKEKEPLPSANTIDAPV